MRCLWIAAALAAGSAVAEETPPAQALPDMVVTATRSEHSAFDLPAAIDAVELDGEDAGPEIKTSEFLARLPGVLARDRQNYAQDEQISIRGYGARSTFGVRGLRLYTDGIPASMPDGQGQTSHFNLAGGDRIEVLRGPYSALYGNSSGGVIQLFSADPSDAFTTSASLGGGSYGQRQLKAGVSDTVGAVGYSLQADAFETDGYRDHSEAQRYLGNGKLVWKHGDASLTLLANGVSIPDAADPQGLTQAEFQANPKQASTAANTFNTRKTVNQYQAGAIWQQPMGEDSRLHVLAYGGHRAVFQMLSVPAGPQGNPLHSGGVVDLGSDYGGFDWRWNWKPKDSPYEITWGFSGERQNQHRRGYENFIGPQLGVQGALRRDELDVVYNIDQYIQGEWRFAPQWTASGGLRHSEVRFSTADRYIVGANPDDSGKKAYEATMPVAGLVFAPADRWRVYASYGRGFETPTFSELAYSPGGAAGLNFALPAARSDNYELGLKHRLEGGGNLQFALFDARSQGELTVLSNTGGRTVYRPVDAQRRGTELSLRQPWSERWSTELAWTWLDTLFRDTGANIPGVPRNSGFASLRWNDAGPWRAALNVQALSRVTVNDPGTMAAPGYMLLGAEGGYAPQGVPWSAYLRLQNLLDTRYAGSVIVNDSNGLVTPASGRYFEPGLPFNVFAGMSLKF